MAAVINDPARHWLLDPEVTFLNHGSYGACPMPVLEAQAEWRARMERQPVAFFHAIDEHLDHARGRLAAFLGSDSDDLAFLPNATTGVNTVVSSLEFQPTDEILTTDHEYNACRNVAQGAAARSGARLVVARVPFPVDGPDEVIDAIMAAVTPRTRLALISHVTTSTALVWPIEQIVARLAEQGIDTLVDGAHAPGMVPLDLAALADLGAAYYSGNCHKWLCAPKGSGFLWVRRDRQNLICPLTTSHGANSPRRDRSPFRLQFDWLGTLDPTAYLAVPAAIDFMASLAPGGWPELISLNRAKALAGRRVLIDQLGLMPGAPDEMIGSMATFELPTNLAPGLSEPDPDDPAGATYSPDPLRDALIDEDQIEVQVSGWPLTPADGPRRRLMRISAQPYNRPTDYERLGAALARRLDAGR